MSKQLRWVFIAVFVVVGVSLSGYSIALINKSQPYDNLVTQYRVRIEFLDREREMYQQAYEKEENRGQKVQIAAKRDLVGSRIKRFELTIARLKDSQ